MTTSDPLDACDPFVDALASGAPTPGGGSASALAGALGAALAAMLCNLTIGREKHADVEDEMRAVLDDCGRLQKSLQALVRADADAYDGFMSALRLPKATDEEKAARREAMGAAAVRAAEVPLETMRQALEVMELAARAAEKGNPNAASDGGVAALLARTAIRAADLNVRINLPSIRDETVRKRLAGEATDLVARSEPLETRALAATGLF